MSSPDYTLTVHAFGFGEGKGLGRVTCQFFDLIDMVYMYLVIIFMVSGDSCLLCFV